MKRTEAHITMTAEDRAELEAWAQQECRSLNMQVLHILRSAIAVRRHSIVELASSPADRVRDATRRAVKDARG